jgi:hypothetical protein
MVSFLFPVNKEGRRFKSCRVHQRNSLAEENLAGLHYRLI